MACVTTPNLDRQKPRRRLPSSLFALPAAPAAEPESKTLYVQVKQNDSQDAEWHTLKFEKPFAEFLDEPWRHVVKLCEKVGFDLVKNKAKVYLYKSEQINNLWVYTNVNHQFCWANVADGEQLLLSASPIYYTVQGI